MTLNSKACIAYNQTQVTLYLKFQIYVPNSSFRLEKMLESNRNLIDTRLLITEQLIIFVKICGELSEQMNKLETLIENKKGHLDNTALESSR